MAYVCGLSIHVMLRGQGLVSFAAVLRGVCAPIGAALLAQRGGLFPWVPVFFGLGIGGYFALPVEPPIWLLIGAALGGIGAWSVALRVPVSAAPLVWALCLIAAGVSVAGARAHLVAGPVVTFRYYGPVEGRVIGLDRSASGAVRVTLDQVVLDDFDPAKVPRRVRIALHGDQGFHDPRPGEIVIVTAHLSPPSGPAEPGGFDFRRHAWFQKIGAVGYTRTPLLLLDPGGGQSLARWRQALSLRIQTQLSGAVGAVASALITGDRGMLPPALLEDLRRANLAHLLAISGLHMGLVTGFVFAVIRIGLAAVPYIGLRVPTKKIAACIALWVAAGYLALSGGNVATERAFVMVAVMLGAVLIDRRALSLRAVAVAASVVLLLRPESLISPGFQMSFSATTGLIAVFGLLRDRDWGPKGWLRWPVTLVLSSAVAGLATAPFGAAHFNMVAQMGLIANLASVPLMGALVMPAAVCAMVLMPLGLEAVPLWVMEQGLRWILFVASWVSEREFAVRFVVSPDWVVLPLFSLGALLVILWRGALRWGGVPVVLLALILWFQTTRPQMLIAEDAGLVGLRTEEGLALSRGKGAGFVAGIWLENDGDGGTQTVAASRWPDRAGFAAASLIVLRGKRAAKTAGCRAGDWLVSTHSVDNALPCVASGTVLTPEALRHSGSLAVYESKNGPRIVTAREISGDRLWNAWVWETGRKP